MFKRLHKMHAISSRTLLLFVGPYLYMGATLTIFQASGMSPSWSDILYMTFTMGAISLLQ